MFQSDYLPVNIGRQNVTVYSERFTFPGTLLKAAKAVLADGAVDPNVILDNGMITFISNPEYSWTIPAIYVASEMLAIAEANKFGYFTVTDRNGIPQLFVSKKIKGHRILVNALTFASVVVTKPNLERVVAAMIDHSYTTVHCIAVFNTIAALERNANNYLDAIIVDRGTESETMCVSPITVMYSNIWEYYSADMLQEMKLLCDGSETETENFKLQNNLVTWKRNETLQSVPVVHMQEMLDLYDRIVAKKCNYICLMSNDCNSHYYISTNWRFFVKANTFEVCVVTNSLLRKTLQQYAKAGDTPVIELNSLWELAKQEVK